MRANRPVFQQAKPRIKLMLAQSPVSVVTEAATCPLPRVWWSWYCPPSVKAFVFVSIRDIPTESSAFSAGQMRQCPQSAWL